MNKPIDNIIQAFGPDIQRAHVSTKLQGGNNFCPSCKQSYAPTYASKVEAMNTDDLTAREQWITGICSDTCWNEFVGPAE
jgi:hypothetical protein